MKVGVYGISYNNEKEVSSWYDSVEFADKIVVIDLGSTDNTVHALKDKHVLVFSIEEENLSLREEVIKNKCIEIFNKNYKDIELLLNIDLNEKLENTSIPYISQIQNTANDSIKYCYTCSIKCRDRSFSEVKLHSNDSNYYWKYPIRACLSFNSTSRYSSVEESLSNVFIERISSNVSKTTKEHLFNVRLLEDLEGKDIWGRIFLMELDPYDAINVRTLEGVASHYKDLTVEQYAYCWYLLGNSIIDKNPLKAIDFYKKCINIIPEWKSPYNKLYYIYTKYGFTKLASEILSTKKSQCVDLKLYIDINEDN